MNYSSYLKKYNKNIYDLINNVNANLIEKSVKLIQKSIRKKSKVYIVGNGGSASIANHVSVDFTKIAKIPSVTFNNSNLITCFANDYGYENWVVEAIKSYTNKNDLMILISSSGTSKNIVNAAQYCKYNKINLITLSGFNKNNPLNKLGNINFHVDSKEYNFIEMSHHIILLSLVDIFAEKN